MKTLPLILVLFLFPSVGHCHQALAAPGSGIYLLAVPLMMFIFMALGFVGVKPRLIIGNLALALVFLIGMMILAHYGFGVLL